MKIKKPRKTHKTIIDHSPCGGVTITIEFKSAELREAFVAAVVKAEPESGEG